MNAEVTHLLRGILILDYGSQYTLLIARRVRELGVYSEVWPCNDPRVAAFIAAGQAPAMGIILSGGPASVGVEGAPRLDGGLLDLGVPVLGICYGMQAMAHALGVAILPAATREYGRTMIQVVEPAGLFARLDQGAELEVWMSHGDSVSAPPPGFSVHARTRGGVLAAIGDEARRLYGLQFHPEVMHTARGGELLGEFLRGVCGCGDAWQLTDFLEETIAQVRAKVGPDERVICGLSGGVDSSVVAALLHRALGERLACVFVDNGLLRLGERELVQEVFERHFGVDLIVVDASERFLNALAGVDDPEIKRKRIGEVFIRVFEEQARQIEGARWLAQGTLYPDVIESVSVRGPSATIKSHHNVGGLPADMELGLIEPLRELFKDEVRELGRQLGLPDAMVDRHPFPGPGLAVRVLGALTEDGLRIAREADHIFISMLREHGLYHHAWQAFAVLLPVRSVGVMGDGRTYDQVIALRAVTSSDGMTADRAHLPMSFLGLVSDRIINEVRGVNRVVYDISSKPPATIEWE